MQNALKVMLFTMLWYKKSTSLPKLNFWTELLLGPVTPSNLESLKTILYFRLLICLMTFLKHLGGFCANFLEIKGYFFN